MIDPNEPEDYDGYVDYITGRSPGLEDITDRIDLLVQAQNYWRWCYDCGSTFEKCEANESGYDRKCCPDCRHPRVEKNVDDVKLAVAGDYLCEVVNRCTCAAPVYGDEIVHEPHCGLEPLEPLGKVRQALHEDVRHAEMQARANAYYEAALVHQDQYKYFFDKRQELLSRMERP